MLFYTNPAVLLLGAAAVSIAAPFNTLERRVQCFDGPYMIVAHGTSETGEGALGSITTGVAEQVPGSGSRGFHYPATLTNYPHSESTGVHVLKQHIREYVHTCGHRAKIMLLGYSQGANVVSDALSGGTFTRKDGGLSRPLKEEFGKHIVAVLQFGDPAFTANLPYDAGTSTQNGDFPRNSEQLQELHQYQGIMRSYCDKNDPYCAGGEKNSHDLTIHGEYFEKYGVEAVAWLVGTWFKRE